MEEYQTYNNISGISDKYNLKHDIVAKLYKKYRLKTSKELYEERITNNPHQPKIKKEIRQNPIILDAAKTNFLISNKKVIMF